MLKGKFAVLSLAAAALLCLQVVSADTVNSGVVDPCNSSATGPAGILFACPQSDGDPLSGPPNQTISVNVRDNVNAPVAGIPAADVWLIGCNDALALCGGSGAINASAPTDVLGNTTITGDIAAGGCENGGLRVVVQGVVIGAGVCADPCVLIKVRSADFNANLVVQINDFSFFVNNGTIPVGDDYPRNPAPNDCRDFNNDNQVGIQDFAKFASHNGHTC